MSDTKDASPSIRTDQALKITISIIGTLLVILMGITQHTLSKLVDATAENKLAYVKVATKLDGVDARVTSGTKSRYTKNDARADLAPLINADVQHTAELAKIEVRLTAQDKTIAKLQATLEAMQRTTFERGRK